MASDNDKIGLLKIKLQNVLKKKVCREREVLKLRNKERSLSEELSIIQDEISNLSQELEMLKKQLALSKHQISMIEICSSSEDVKISAQTGILNAHLERYQQLFEKEQLEMELRVKEQRAKEEKLLEMVHQKELQIAEENQKRERETADIEEESQAIEQECAVLKKRNNAILLKLRKKLLETENLRREREKRSF